MNPYEATLPNIMSRIGAWLRGLVRLYRRPLLLIAAAAVVALLAVSTTLGPAISPAVAVTSPTLR